MLTSETGLSGSQSRACRLVLSLARLSKKQGRMPKRLSLPREETGPAEWRAGLKHDLIWSAAPGHDNEHIYHLDVRSCPGSARFDTPKELSFDSGGQEMVHRIHSVGRAGDHAFEELAFHRVSHTRGSGHSGRASRSSKLLSRRPGHMSAFETGEADHKVTTRGAVARNLSRWSRLLIRRPYPA